MQKHQFVASNPQQKLCELCSMPRTPYHTTARVQISEEQWEDTGTESDPSARLNVWLDVQVGDNVVSMHLEAYAVRYDDEGIQHFVDEVADWAEAEFYGITEGAVETITIRGREYALCATPHTVT